MKRSFVRVLWGEFLEEDELCRDDLEKKYNIKYDPENKILIRRVKINLDIQQYLEKEFKIPFVTYVFGKKNHQRLIEMGLKSVLIYDEPYKYNPIRGLYQHKLDAHQYMMEDFDEIVFLDWDTYLTKPLPDNFWDVLNKKEVFQASLNSYRTPRINHRKNVISNKAIPTGAFVYMRDKSIPKRLIELNTKAPNKWSCEPSFALLTDEITGGWQNDKKYFELFEPEFYTAKRSPYRFTKELRKENVCFKNGFDV